MASPIYKPIICLNMHVELLFTQRGKVDCYHILPPKDGLVEHVANSLSHSRGLGTSYMRRFSRYSGSPDLNCSKPA
jgi:hypothetical protein